MTLFSHKIKLVLNSALFSYKILVFGNFIVLTVFLK